jgi:hypothetical protein
MPRYFGQPWRVPTDRVEAGAPRFAGQTSASVDGETIHKSPNDILVK